MGKIPLNPNDKYSLVGLIDFLYSFITITNSIISLTLESLTLTGTTPSTSSTTGVLLSAGGIGISNTTNSSSSTNGGTFTTAGGMAIAKDLWVGGTIYGGTGGGGTISNPVISTTNVTNCSSITYSNSILFSLGTYNILSANIIVSPTTTNTPSVLTINNIPSKTNVFVTTYDAVLIGTGRTSDNVSIENIFLSTNTSTLNATLSFTSSSTNPHYISISGHYSSL